VGIRAAEGYKTLTLNFCCTTPLALLFHEPVLLFILSHITRVFLFLLALSDRRVNVDGIITRRIAPLHNQGVRRLLFGLLVVVLD
jgi:hypothetical protein